MKGIMPLVFIALSIGLFFLFIDPQYEETKQLKEKIESQKELLQLAAELRKKRDDLQQKFNNISAEDRAKLEKVLPDTIDNVRLLRDMDIIAKKKGISISNISIKDQNQAGGEGVVDKTGQTYGTLGLSFSVSSRYDVFKDFMQSLENSLRLVDVNNFSVSAGEGSFYNFNISLDTYWLR